MTIADSPELATVIRNAISARLVDVHTAMPAKVQSYDSDSQTADIEPELSRIVRDAAGVRSTETLPIIPCVPVAFPGAGGFFVAFPVQAGDTGLLIFNEYAIDRWRADAPGDPGDERRHGLSGAVFIPGLKTSSNALADADATDMRIGQDGGTRIDIKATGVIEIGAPGATEAIGLGDAIKGHLDAIQSWADAHTHILTISAAAGAGGTGTAAVPVPSSPMPPTVASQHKVEP